MDLLCGTISSRARPHRGIAPSRGEMFLHSQPGFAYLKNVELGRLHLGPSFLQSRDGAHIHAGFQLKRRKRKRKRKQEVILTYILKTSSLLTGRKLSFFKKKPAKRFFGGAAHGPPRPPALCPRMPAGPSPQRRSTPAVTLGSTSLLRVSPPGV